MGSSGHVDFFTREPVRHPGEALLECARIAGAARLTYAFRSIGPSHEWKHFQREKKRPRNFREGVLIEKVKGPPREKVADRCDVAVLSKLFKPRTSISVLLSDTSLLLFLREAVNRSIPEFIRGRFDRDYSAFSLDSLYIHAGWHDIFEWSENPEGHLFARAFFSISFYGNRDPLNWQEYRRLVFQVPEMQEAKRSFERVLGPLEECAYWHT